MFSCSSVHNEGDTKHTSYSKCLFIWRVPFLQLEKGEIKCQRVVYININVTSLHISLIMERLIIRRPQRTPGSGVSCGTVTKKGRGSKSRAGFGNSCSASMQRTVWGRQGPLWQEPPTRWEQRCAVTKLKERGEGGVTCCCWTVNMCKDGNLEMLQGLFSEQWDVEEKEIEQGRFKWDLRWYRGTNQSLVATTCNTILFEKNERVIFKHSLGQ